jgi:hypothetical protein
LKCCSNIKHKLFHKIENYILLFSSLFLVTEKCKSSLGMESGAIADFQITASSAHDIGNVGPQHARYVLIIYLNKL